MPDEIMGAILFVLIWLAGFFAGRAWNARKMLEEIRDMQAGLERVKALHNQYEKITDEQISSLVSENKQLRSQLELLMHGIGVVDRENRIVLTGAMEESLRTNMNGE